MAVINGKTRYISTISRKNRELWTVYQSERDLYFFNPLFYEEEKYEKENRNDHDGSRTRKSSDPKLDNLSIRPRGRRDISRKV